MKTVSIIKAQQNLFELVLEVNANRCPITIINAKGKNAVLVSEDEWRSIEETFYLSSIPGYVENINNIRNNETWEKTSKYDILEKW